MLYVPYRAFGNVLGNCISDKQYLKYIQRQPKPVSIGEFSENPNDLCLYNFNALCKLLLFHTDITMLGVHSPCVGGKERDVATAQATR